jgi:hypothetical protein
MQKKIACVVSIWLVVANAMLFAQGTIVPPGRWNKVQKEKPGTGIIVTLHGGEMITCALKSFSQETITVVTAEDKEREIPKIAVKRIITEQKRSGPLWNGLIIGAAIPATIGIISVASYHGDNSGAAGPIAGMIAIGALIGIGCDAAVRNQNVLYDAPNIKKD